MAEEAGDAEMRTKLDSLIEILDQAKVLHSLKPAEAEVLYKKVFTDGTYASQVARDAAFTQWS